MTRSPVQLPTLTNEPENKSLPAVFDFSAADWCRWLDERGQSAMRVRQIQRWLLQGGAQSFSQMTDLPQALRTELERHFTAYSTKIDRQLRAKDYTHKLLLSLRDNRRIECVLIQEDGRRTACISTQVGCGMGCVFCASGLNGVERNLSSGEILEQLLHLKNLPPPANNKPKRLTHIVVMGMGEPLANLDELLPALDIAVNKSGLGLSARHVTISTVGLPRKMVQLAQCGKPYHLAVSLHAPNDVLRSEIVPTNDKTGIPAIMEAADHFFNKTGRQVTFEYVLLGGLNDGSHHARELVRLLQGRRAHVNLIPFNDVEGLPYKRPSRPAQQEFVQIVRSAGISVKVRKRKGADIDAACGQLRRKVEAAL